MYAQEFMKSVLLALTDIFSDSTNIITDFRNLDAITPAKSGNVLSGIVNLVIGSLSIFVEAGGRLLPWTLDIGDRVVYVVSTNSTTNSAFHNISVNETLPHIVGPSNGTYGLTYLINATVNVGVDGANYTGDPTVSVNLLTAMYQVVATILNLLGEIGVKLPQMFPWG